MQSDISLRVTAATLMVDLKPDQESYAEMTHQLYTFLKEGVEMDKAEAGVGTVSHLNPVN